MATTTTRETTRDGFDMVMVRECGEWLCSLYRAGGQVPLSRKLVADETKAEKWFASQMKRWAK